MYPDDGYIKVQLIVTLQVLTELKCVLDLGPHGSPPTTSDGGFGVTFNDITKDSDFYTTTSRFVVCLIVWYQVKPQSVT